MHEVPAAWYDDPEDPTQYRYWDGSAWTEHRAPKHASAAPPARRGVLKEAWNLGKETVGPLIGIAALYFLALLPAMILLGVGATQSLDPPVGDILDRMAEPGFDPVNDDGDREFWDSIDFEPTATFWVLVAIAIALSIPVTVLAYSIAIILMANRFKGGSMQFNGAWSLGLRRFVRHFRISLVWMLCYVAAMAPLVGLWILAIAVSPYWFAIAVPVTIGVAGYVLPFIWLSFAALYTGPTDRPPWRNLMAVVKPQWTSIAGPVYLAAIVMLGIILVGSAMNVIPLLGFVVGLAANIAQWILQYGSGVVLWDRFGGEFDPAILDEAPSPT